MEDFLQFLAFFSAIIMLLLLASWLDKRLEAGIRKDKLQRKKEKEVRSHRWNWKWRYQNLPRRLFGHGCVQPFSYYLEGTSEVEIRNIDELCDWLLECRYESDVEIDGAKDHWQHPDDFELKRSGDCEDFALWTWRKLKQMGHHTEFTVGKWIQDNGRIGTHAWVVYEVNRETVILETTGRSRERMIKPLDQHMDNYIPFAAVDSQLRKKVYNGVIRWLGILVKQ